jgi:hypothetical protein
MDHSAAFYEEARDLGEVVTNGVRYRVLYDPKRHCTVCVLVPGQELAIVPLDDARNR